MLDQPETSPLEKNLRFVKNEIDDQLNEMFAESQQQSPAPFKMVKPYPGICLKTFKTGKKEKFFINICHTKEIPAPKDITESELHKLIEQQNASNFKVPLSVTKPRLGKDKSGFDVEISDVAVNSEFFASKIKSGGLFYHLLITLVFESLEQKYQTELDTSNFIELKNRACIGQLVEHQIYSRDVNTVTKSYAEEEKHEMLGEDDTDQISIGTRDQKKPPGKVLIQEISPDQPVFKPRKSVLNEPEHRIISDFNASHQRILIAEFYLPHVRSVDEVSVEANEDRLVVESRKHGYYFEGFLPHQIDESTTQAEFDKEHMILKVTMTV